MAAKILTTTFNAATPALVKTAFDAWAAAGQVVISISMTYNAVADEYDLFVTYYA
jgi:hypothetical protein